MAAIIEQLSSIVREAEVLITGLNGSLFNNDELQALDALAGRLTGAATAIEKKTGSFKPSREEQAWKASEEFRNQSQSTITAVFDNGQLKNETVFRRSLVLIFVGPKHSNFDSKEVKSRKIVTRRRCERIQKLSPDGIVAWAVSYTPTSWAAGSMGNDVFDCLIEDIEPNDVQAWPTAIRETLQKLRDHEDLQASSDYDQFVNAIVDPPHNDTDDENDTVLTATANSSSRPPANENREMKYIFTNAPAKNISKLPQPFRRAVRNSKLWKWERSQRYITTSCWATLFPKDATQDVSVTIWCGHNDGYRLNDIYGVQRAMSS